MPIFRNRQFAAFLFDMDGTMLDSSLAVERTWRMWADHHGIDPEPLLAACHGVQTADTIRRFGPADVDVSAEAQWLHKAEMADVDSVVPIKGIVKLIAGLPSSSWAIVTSAPRELAIARLAAVGLPLPRVMVAAEDVSRSKPDPEGFLKAASLLGIAIEDCLIFEDSPAGVAAARSAGGSVTVVGNLVEAEPDDFKISDYA